MCGQNGMIARKSAWLSVKMRIAQDYGNAQDNVQHFT